MTEPEASITVAVDPTNPGQFFACCGLLELADRLWPGAEGWFADDGRAFHIAFTDRTRGTLSEVLSSVKSLKIEGYGDSETVGEDENDDDDDEAVFEPLILTAPVGLRLDWFADISLKPWAGSMKPKPILVAMAHAIDPDCTQPFQQSLVTRDPSTTRVTRGRTTTVPGKPREPFYFDSRRGANVIDRDVGFVPDALKKAYKRYTHAYPVVEVLAPIGLQRARPKRAKRPREFEYFCWSWRLPCALLPAVVVGEVGPKTMNGFRFRNAFRTGQEKHKAYMQATPIPPGDEQ